MHRNPSVQNWFIIQNTNIIESVKEGTDQLRKGGREKEKEFQKLKLKFLKIF